MSAIYEINLLTSVENSALSLYSITINAKKAPSSGYYVHNVHRSAIPGLKPPLPKIFIHLNHDTTTSSESSASIVKV